MSLNIKSIEVIGLMCDCQNTCNHFCIVEYNDKTHHTVKISGDILVKKYWSYLDEPSRKHLHNIYEKYNLKSIKINPLCLQSDPCQHECILIFNDDVSKADKTLRGDYIAEIYWDYLTEAGKIHFGVYKKDINFSKLSID